MKYPVSDSYKLFIGGRWIEASDGAVLDTYCPANGERIVSIADATREDVDAAVDAAHEAFVSWGRTDKTERARILTAVADIIEENAEHLGTRRIDRQRQADPRNPRDRRGLFRGALPLLRGRPARRDRRGRHGDAADDVDRAA